MTDATLPERVVDASGTRPTGPVERTEPAGPVDPARPTDQGDQGDQGNQGNQGNQEDQEDQDQDQTDIVAALQSRHAAIAEAFTRFGQAADDDREDRFGELDLLLSRHEIAEQNVVHPVTRQGGPDGDQIAADRLAEEQEVERAIAELENLGLRHPDFERTFRTFHETVLAHIAHEEKEEFPLLSGLPAEQRHRMAEEFLRMSDDID